MMRRGILHQAARRRCSGKVFHGEPGMRRPHLLELRQVGIA